MTKIHVNNSDYMEFIDDVATMMTEIAYKGDAFMVRKGLQFTQFSDEAQDYYNERYDEVETMLNRTLKVYGDEV